MITTPLYLGSFCRNFGACTNDQVRVLEYVYDRVWRAQDTAIHENLLSGLLSETHVAYSLIVHSQSNHLVYGVIDEMSSGIVSRPGEEPEDEVQIRTLVRR